MYILVSGFHCAIMRFLLFLFLLLLLFVNGKFIVLGIGKERQKKKKKILSLRVLERNTKSNRSGTNNGIHLFHDFRRI